MFTKITTYEQAKEFADFANNKFNSINNLKDWLNPITGDLGVVEQVEFSIHFPPSYKKDMKQRDFLMLSFGINQTVVFVGNVYENWRENYIYVIIDFSDKDNYSKKIIDLKNKNDARIALTNEIHSILWNM